VSRSNLPGVAAVAFAAAVALPAAGKLAVPDTGVEVDALAYAGLWYEIARSPAPFQEMCEGGATAFYESLEAGKLLVVNRCDLADGQVARIEGTAQALNERFNAFEVDFPQSPDEGVNYLIEGLGPLEDGRYRWTAVRSPDGYAWILARTPDLPEAERQAAEAALAEAGFDIGLLQPTDQPPDNYDPRG
jgi:apolipoprotein D and lipocalin family protein